MGERSEPALDRHSVTTRREILAGLGALALKRLTGQGERLVVDGLDTSAINDGFLQLVRQGGVHCVHKTLFQEASFRDLHAFAASRAATVTVATSVAAIRAARSTGRIALVLGSQAASGMYGNGIGEAMAEAPLGSLGLIRPALERLYQLGLRVQGLCYNVSDLFGSGCLDPTGHLSRAGWRLVDEIHRARVVLDVGGHTGERTSLDALAMSPSVPVVCSHTNFAALNPNRRCISGRLAESIAKTGGLIGLTAVSDFLVRNATTARTHGTTSPQATLEVLLDHFDYGRRLVGAEHLALGPDFRWGQGTAAIDPTDTVTFTPDELSAGPLRDVVGFEHIGELPNLVAGLKGRGWSEGDLNQVLGGSWLRVFGRVWGG